MTNYGRKLRIGTNIRKKGKIEKAIEFVESIKRVQEEARMVLRKAQEEMKQQADRGRKEGEEQKIGDKMILSIKDFVFKE